MIRKFAAATLVVAATLSFAASAQAGDFAAAPMNSGPAKVTGLGPVGEIANVALIPTNVLAPPAMSVVTAVTGGPVPVAEPVGAPIVRRHRHHHHMKKM